MSHLRSPMGYDEPETLSYSIIQICLKGADVRQLSIVRVFETNAGLLRLEFFKLQMPLMDAAVNDELLKDVAHIVDGDRTDGLGHVWLLSAGLGTNERSIFEATQA